MFDSGSLAVVVSATLGSVGGKLLVDKFFKREGVCTIVVKSPSGIISLDSNEKLTDQRLDEIKAALSAKPTGAAVETFR